MGAYAPSLSIQQSAVLDRLFADHTTLCRDVAGTAARCIIMLRYVFHSPRDVRRQILYLEDRDIRPSTSREAFFLAVARTLCKPLEPENWRALLGGQAFLFDLGPAVFRFTLVPSPSDPGRTFWHFGKIIFDDAPPPAIQSDTALNPWPADAGAEPAGNPGRGQGPCED